MSRISLVYFNAGGGHRAAAQALAQVIAEQQRPWQVSLVNLTEVLDPQASFQKLTGMAPEDLYNKRLARGWTLGLAQELKLLQGLIRLGQASIVRALKAHWHATQPDMVVSLVPNFNRALCESLVEARPGVPFVTVMTDMADHPPNFWIEPMNALASTSHMVCGTAEAVAQARGMGYPAARVHVTSGMILRPDFYRDAIDRDAERLRLGLAPGVPTGVVLFGGQGAKVMHRIATALADVPLILMCGHNRVLADVLRALPASAPRVVVEFTPDVSRYLQLADFFIGKPGPGSLSEAVQAGLPVITVRNAWTMPQERFNTDWVRQCGVGVVLRSFDAIAPAVADVIARLEGLRDRVRQIDNRAVFEVPDILAGILDPARPPAASAVAASAAAAVQVAGRKRSQYDTAR